MAIGVCKLTGSTGELIRSHLIPRALTKPEELGAGLLQAGKGQRPVRRRSSWYDPELVTEEGERFLSALDDWAVEFLRAQKLVWSGWGPMQALGELQAVVPFSPYGIRRIRVEAPHKLRLFFLSLAWRAAASTLPDFDDVSLPAADVERLRLMIVSGSAEPLGFYPILLTQLSTRGMIHNQSPIIDEKVIPSLDGTPERKVPFLRFYFDGLVAHLHIGEDGRVARDKLAAGAHDDLVISTVTYEHSFQRENVLRIMAEAAFHPLKHPGGAVRSAKGLQT